MAQQIIRQLWYRQQDLLEWRRGPSSYSMFAQVDHFNKSTQEESGNYCQCLHLITLLMNTFQCSILESDQENIKEDGDMSNNMLNKLIAHCKSDVNITIKQHLGRKRRQGVVLTVMKRYIFLLHSSSFTHIIIRTNLMLVQQQ